MKTQKYEIFVTRNAKDVFVGSCNIETAKRIHRNNIKTINYESKTIYLNPETPYGKD